MSKAAEIPFNKKRGLVKRNGITIRKRNNGGETLMTQLAIQDPEIITALEKKCAEDSCKPSFAIARILREALNNDIY